MAEAAVTMPVVLLVLMFGINISLASYTAVAASNAANYAARVGAVSRVNPQFWAYKAAQASLNSSRTGGTFGVPSVQVNPNPGGVVVVTIHWEYPSLFGGLCAYFGHVCPESFSGNAVSAWKKEGW